MTCLATIQIAQKVKHIPRCVAKECEHNAETAEMPHAHVTTVVNSSTKNGIALATQPTITVDIIVLNCEFFDIGIVQLAARLGLAYPNCAALNKCN